MSAYRLLFIDEEKENFDYFLDYVEGAMPNTEVEVITELPLRTLEEMIEHIISLNPDAIITDHMLNDMRIDIDYNVPYNGVELVQEFLSIREHFPCFVLTSFDDLAVNESEDVNKVYIKNILHSNKEETKAKAKFIDRVISQINHYKVKIDEAREELNKLLELRSSGEANIDDEERIIKLDSFLEQSIDKRNAIPNEFKGFSNTNRLEQLLAKVDKLIDKIGEDE